MSGKWYRNSYRRNLVDMHIDDWNKEFLSQFDVDSYFEYLKTAKVDSVMLYLQSHVGLCHYPTASGKMHGAFSGKEDQIRRLADKCRENGIAVVGYYSLIFNTYEEDRHPEWRLVDDREGKTSLRQRGSRYGHCCPNNAEYRVFLTKQIDEIAKYFTLDGMFYDMTYWSGICYCENCRKRFFEETGISELPNMDDLKAPEAKLFLKKRFEWIAEFARWITDYTRNAIPGVSVSHNNAYEISGDWHEASWEGVSDCSDYCTGDLYGDIYDHSFCMKYYLGATRNMPFEYMVSRFSRNLTQHTMSKSVEELTQDILLTTAHHGANFVIDAIDPVGTLDMRVAKLIGGAYARQIPYEKYISEGELVGDVAIWYSTTGRYNTEGQTFNSRSCCAVLSKTLSRNHVPYAVIANTATGKMSKYRVVFAPAIAGLEKTHIEDTLKYVREGGTLVFSGIEEKGLLEEFFGARFEGFTESKHTYIAPTEKYKSLFCGFDEKYPLAMSHCQPLIKIDKDAEIMAYIKLPYISPENPKSFAAIHSNPPGKLTDYPAVIQTRYGKGRVIWLSLAIEGYDTAQHREITRELLRYIYAEEDQSVVINGYKQVETISFKSDEKVLMSFIDMGYTEEKIHIPSFEVSVAVDRCPKSVHLLPDGESIEFSYDGNKVSFNTRELDLLDMYSIET